MLQQAKNRHLKICSRLCLKWQFKQRFSYKDRQRKRAWLKAKLENVYFHKEHKHGLALLEKSSSSQPPTSLKEIKEIMSSI